MPAPAPLLPGPALPTILLATGDPTLAQELRQLLAPAGYRVRGPAATEAEVLPLIRSNRPALVLLDLLLAGPPAPLALAAQLHELDVPFVYLVADADGGLTPETQATQPAGCITHPCRRQDVLTTLELAWYRHTHGPAARGQQEQQLQIALTDALSGAGTWEARLLQVAKLLRPHVPFDYLILGLKNDHSANVFRACAFLQTGPDTYQTIWLREFLQAARLTWDDAMQVLDANPYDAPTLSNGDDFAQACRHNPLKRLLAASYQLQSNLMIPLKTAQHGTFFFSFYSAQPASYRPEHLHLLERLQPSLALTLDRLMAFEEIEAQKQVTAAELAIIQAFTRGQPYAATIEQVAVVIDGLIPCDLLSVYRAGMRLEGSVMDVTFVKQAGAFAPFALIDLLPQPEDQPQWQRKLDEISAVFGRAGLYVGESYAQLAHQNEVTRFYSNSLGLHSCVIVPIVIKGQPMASLVLASRQAYGFSQQDFQLFQRLGLQMALGFENHLAFERIEGLRQQLELENSYLLEEVKTKADFEQIIGSSPLLQHVFRSVGQVAPTDYTVLLLGETGTGKELIARAVHNRSARKGKPLIKINCATLPPQLIESELFGHEKGSFTGATEQRIGKFELANGGTIFLDEIGELPLELQPKLLRVLQEKEFERIGGKRQLTSDVRIIAATNRNLQQEVAAGRFRADLYYRLHVFPITMPALRERLEDLQPLAAYFLRKIAKQLGKPLTGLSVDSLRQMLAYHWPGNVRELEHLLERAAIMATSPVVSLVEPLGAVAAAPASPAAGIKSFEQAERDNLLAALELTHYRIRGAAGAAALLQLKPTTLEAKMARHGIVRHPPAP
ncbi:sigma 54-interacting transcriptional regulator [Hymenobacter sp. 15J16-1T3B]|uniref:sigma 54-interacting transcriptional regulator n=1 Tax=Hymenobacter sp. 15J16-1T3B TaxID=2886941 RepID=UPI001D10CEDD|nr:sigma 54-interacting transcriptional regulator [Hymenobacter sp. 15J16-1T3B]MCC3159771.1 sigma 54-interacting transcriptional regulator [Hymenobacter sp. 15J16-1T3B]